MTVFATLKREHFIRQKKDTSADPSDMMKTLEYLYPYQMQNQPLDEVRARALASALEMLLLTSEWSSSKIRSYTLMPICSDYTVCVCAYVYVCVHTVIVWLLQNLDTHTCR